MLFSFLPPDPPARMKRRQAGTPTKKEEEVPMVEKEEEEEEEERRIPQEAAGQEWMVRDFIKKICRLVIYCMHVPHCFAFLWGTF